MKKSSKSIATGNPPDIAKIEGSEANAWNVIVRIDGADITFAAIDQDHAQDLCKSINDCAWVSLDS